MQSPLNLAHSVYRVVFRGGSPQRIQYSDQRLIAAVLATVVLSIGSQVLFFNSSIIETGLGLFTLLTGTYLLSALLTRKVPRGRLRQTLLAIFLIFAMAQVILLIGAPFTTMATWITPLIAGVVAVCILMGAKNSLRFALGCSAISAWGYALLYAFALGAFYATMHFLLRTVFS
jgi:hypothetical protein